MRASTRPPFSRSLSSWNSRASQVCVDWFCGILEVFVYAQCVVLCVGVDSDGVSTNLNISGSHDSCVLDCPTTDDGCVQATCCQNNNKVCLTPLAVCEV